MNPSTNGIETYNKIIRLAKVLGFPAEFTKKNITDLMTFLKTKEFIIMLKVRVHNLINGVVFEQFNVHNRNNRIQVPHLLKNSHMGGESATSDVA